MIDDDIVTRDGETVFGEALAIAGGLLSITRPESKMLNNDVVALQNDPPVSDRDAVPRGRLTGDGDI